MKLTAYSVDQEHKLCPDCLVLKIDLFDANRLNQRK